jgi:prepilin-type N-terminal cleavage/methylation domain-containing protein
MSNTFTKTSLRGFTLIELLVVIAIIGLLSTAIMGPVQTGLKKGRDTRKISDITQIQGALLQYAGDNNGGYPTYLDNLSPTYMSVDPKMKIASAARDRFMYTVYADKAGNLVSYHLGTALENQNASLQGDKDCGVKSTTYSAPVVVPSYMDVNWGSMDAGTPLAVTDATPIPSTAPIPANSECISIASGFLMYSNWTTSGAGNPSGTASSTDFGGAGTAESTSGVCGSKLTTCIFDITPN